MDFPTAAITEAAKAFTASEAAPSTPTPVEAPASAPSPTPVPAPTSVVAAPEGELAPAITPTEGNVEAPAVSAVPDPIVLDDTKHYRVVTKVDGKEQEEILTGAQIRDGRMSKRKFTQNMQQVRSMERNLLQEKQGIAEIRRRAEEATAILGDRARLAAHIQNAFPGMTLAQANAMAAQQQNAPGYQPAPQTPGAQPPPQFDPDTLASVGDIQTALNRAEQDLGRRLTEYEQSLVARIQQVESQMETVVNNTLSKLTDAHEVAGYNQKIQSTIESLKQELPALAQIPDIDDLLRFKVSQMNPSSPEEMFEFLDAHARAIDEGLGSVYNQRHQAALAAKAKMVSSGAEAPAGVAPTFQRRPGHRNAEGKFDWNLLTQEAKARANLG